MCKSLVDLTRAAFIKFQQINVADCGKKFCAKDNIYSEFLLHAKTPETTDEPTRQSKKLKAKLIYFHCMRPVLIPATKWWRYKKCREWLLMTFSIMSCGVTGGDIKWFCFLFLSLQNIHTSAKSQTTWKHNKSVVQAKSNNINIHTWRAGQIFEGGVLKACTRDWIIKGEVEGCSGDVLGIRKGLDICSLLLKKKKSCLSNSNLPAEISESGFQ